MFSDVFERFWMFSDVFGSFGKFLDVFRPLAMLSVSYVYGPTVGFVFCSNLVAMQSLQPKIVIFFSFGS